MYVDDSKCPYCGSTNIKGVDGFVYDNDAVVDCQDCQDCNKRFWIIYKAVRIEDVNGHVIEGRNPYE